MRRTYAPFLAVVAFCVGGNLAGESVASVIIVGLIFAVIAYIVVTKIEDAIYSGIGKAGKKLEEKLNEKLNDKNQK